ncbi:GNAT family N-acetyltransferase [Actinoplanes sp. NPDC024001]|uniref:GNAT family N-acetyltransferase n=1 Tax=Actinoplanes sp. NPDC024001 TaxID=3154598 RepID=UPI0033C5BF96
MDISVRRLGPDDWRVWRAARLAALAEAPHAFGSSLAKEQQYQEGDWRDWLDPGRGLKAVAGDLAGMIGAWVPEDRGGAVEIYSVYVAPAWRGRGVGDLLVGEALAWARENGHERVDLWVVDGNASAAGLYLRHGFRATDEVQPLPSNPDLVERIMSRDLRQPDPVS